MSRSQEHLSKKQVEELARKYVEVLKVKADAQFRELHDQKGKQLISESRERLAGVVANHAKRVMMDYKKELSKSGGETLRELLGDFFEELSKKIYDASNPLVNVTLPPANTRFFYNNGSNTVAVVEQPPQIRTVIVKDKLAGTTKGQELYRISLPYVIFVVKLSDNKFEGLYVYYRKRPLESMRSRLYETNFPNTKSCNVCLGFDGHKSEDLGERINEIITHFWNSPFNKDWNGSYEEYQSEDSRLSFRNWEIETRENPNFIFDVKWSQASTLSERINSLVNLDDHKKALKVKLDAATDNFQEQLLMALDDLPIFNDIKERAMTAIDKHESAIIIQLSKLIEQTFMDVNQDPNFDQQCFEEISQIMSELLDKDFREISNALELRTQMSLEELMQAIKNSPEQ